jgi:peptidoglycan L-alanyl-D-glutamate endopeptidase CwlK
MNASTIAKLNLLYPDFKVRVMRVFSDMKELHGIEMMAVEGLRTFEKQAKYYAQGRTEPGAIITNAKPGQSLHHYGVALDACGVGGNWKIDWKLYGQCARNHGLRHGGDWNGNGIIDKNDFDNPHIDLRYGGLDWFDMLPLYNSGGLASVWAKFDKIRGVVVGSEWNQDHNINRVVMIEKKGILNA